MRKTFISLFLLACLGTAFATSRAEPLRTVTLAASMMCNDAKSLLPVVAMLMTVVAGVVYAAGQIMGAETRARANVWATACLTGALIGVLIYAVAPSVLSTIYNTQEGSYVDIAAACV